MVHGQPDVSCELETAGNAEELIGQTITGATGATAIPVSTIGIRIH